MSDMVPASSLTGASVPVGWTPTGEIVLAYLKKKIGAWQVLPSREGCSWQC